MDVGENQYHYEVPHYSEAPVHVYEQGPHYQPGYYGAAPGEHYAPHYYDTAHHTPSYYSDAYGEHYAPRYDHYGGPHHYYNNEEEENPISASFDISGTFGGKKNAEYGQAKY